MFERVFIFYLFIYFKQKQPKKQTRFSDWAQECARKTSERPPNWRPCTLQLILEPISITLNYLPCLLLFWILLGYTELPHLYKTLNVQQVMYNTLDVQQMNIQHLEYTTHEYTTTWMYNTLNIQHLEWTTLECTTLECTTHKLVGHWTFVLLDICPTRKFVPLGHLSH